MKTSMHSATPRQTGQLFHSLVSVEKERDVLKSQCIALRNKLKDANNLLLKVKENSSYKKLEKTQKELQHYTEKYHTETQALTKELETTKIENAELKKQMNTRKPQICYEHEDKILELEKEVKRWQMKHENYALINRENKHLKEREKMLKREIENCKVSSIAPIKSDQVAIKNSNMKESINPRSRGLGFLDIVANDDKNTEKPVEDIVVNEAINDFLNDSFSSSNSENEKENGSDDGPLSKELINKHKEEIHNKKGNNVSLPSANQQLSNLSFRYSHNVNLSSESDTEEEKQTNKIKSSTDTPGFPPVSRIITTNENSAKSVSPKPFGLGLIDSTENNILNIEKSQSKEKPNLFLGLNLSLSDSESEAEEEQTNKTKSSDIRGFPPVPLTSLPLVSELIPKNEDTKKTVSPKPLSLGLIDSMENNTEKIEIPSKQKPELFSGLNLSLSDSESEDEERQEEKNDKNDKSKVKTIRNNTNEVQSNQNDSALPTFKLFARNSDSSGTVAFSTSLRKFKKRSLSSKSEESDFSGINDNQNDITKNNPSCKSSSRRPFSSPKKLRKQSLIDDNNKLVIDEKKYVQEENKQLNISIEQEKQKLNEIKFELIQTEEQFKAIINEEINKLDGEKDNKTKFETEMAKQEVKLIFIKKEIESIYKNFSKIIENQEGNCAKIGRLEEEQKRFNLIKLNVDEVQKKIRCMEEELKILKEENGNLKTALETIQTKDNDENVDHITIRQVTSLATKIARAEIRKHMAKKNLIMKRKLNKKRRRLIEVGFKRGKNIRSEQRIVHRTNRTLGAFKNINHRNGW